MYRHKITNPEKEYHDRTEILKTDFLLQDRIEGIVGMTVEEVFVRSDSFTMLCSDKKNRRGMRIQLARSDYGDYGGYLRLSATEIIYKSEQEKEEWDKKEEARREKLRVKEKDIKRKVDVIRGKHKAKAKDRRTVSCL